MRLIDADAFKLYVQRCILIDEDLSTEQIERYLLAAIDGFTEIDAVPVVRCKECKHLYDELDDYRCMSHRGLVRICENSFCSYGERRKE